MAANATAQTPVDDATAALLGREVIIHSLKGAAELNGMCGVVLGFNDEKGRFIVDSPGKGSPVLIKADNIKIAPDAASTIAAACSSEHADEVRSRVQKIVSNAPDKDDDGTPPLVLDLENTELHELPDVIGTLSGLSAGGCLGLWLGSNELTKLPNSIGNLVALRSLDVDNNKLTALPNSIGNLVCLESLYANHNRLAQLPATIGKLRTLRELRVSDNQLCDEDALPVELGSGLAKCLKSLWLARNGLGALPPAVCGLKALEELDICGNAELCELPMDFDALGRLETLDLAGNEALIWPPSSVWKEASRPAYAVRQWIEKQRKESEEVVYAHEPPGSIHAPMKPEEVGGSTTADGGGEFVFPPKGWK